MVKLAGSPVSGGLGRPKQTFATAWEQPDKCQAEASTCQGKAVGIVVFKAGMGPGSPPARVPLGVCDKHMSILMAVYEAGGAESVWIDNLALYVP